MNECQVLQGEVPNSLDEVHSLLLDQVHQASADKPDNAAKRALETASQNNVKSSDIESTPFSHLDYSARCPYLFTGSHLGEDVFGLQDMHRAAPAFTNYMTKWSGVDTNLLIQRTSKDSSLFPPPPGFRHSAQPYRSPFQRGTSPLLHYKNMVTLSDITSYSDQNQNTLFPLSSGDQNYGQSAVTISSIKNESQTVSASQSDTSSTMPYEHSASGWTIDVKNIMPFTPKNTADSNEEDHEYKRDSVFDINRQLFPNAISPTAAPASENDIPGTRSQVSSAGTIGDSKPIGLVPAVKGTKMKNEAETTMEAGDAQEENAVAAAAPRLTTTARVQPSSTVQPQQQTTNNTNTEISDSDLQSSETGDEYKNNTNNIPRPPPPIMPGYPAPWPMPPYPGGPYPYPFYPPWPYCPPMPMMPMMHHPMMQMVPVPCWMPPPMHPAMRMRPPLMPASAADTNEKAEVSSEAKSLTSTLNNDTK